VSASRTGFSLSDFEFGGISRVHRLNGLRILNVDGAAEAKGHMLGAHHFDFVFVFHSTWKFGIPALEFEIPDGIQPQTSQSLFYPKTI
jgi:hypothetical protein